MNVTFRPVQTRFGSQASDQNAYARQVLGEEAYQQVQQLIAARIDQGPPTPLSHEELIRVADIASNPTNPHQRLAQGVLDTTI